MPALLPRYTVDMLDAMPEEPGFRYEIIDGFLFVTPAAGSAHAELTARLLFQLLSGIPRELARVAPPGEVRVGKYHSLVPDLLIYPARYPLGARWKNIRGWYLAVEIVSPSSKVYDREHKRHAYLALGVGEYWIVDAETQAVEVWRPGARTADVRHDRVELQLPGALQPVSIDLRALFDGVPPVRDD